MLVSPCAPVNGFIFPLIAAVAEIEIEDAAAHDIFPPDDAANFVVVDVDGIPREPHVPLT